MTSERPDDRHWLQRFMDNVWLLLVLGIVIPTVSYTLWAWLEIWLAAPAALP